MNQALSSAWSWVAALAIAAPIIALFWWARRHAPVGPDQAGYSVGLRVPPPDGHAAPTLFPAAHGVADAPAPANPAALASPTEMAVPPAVTVTLPAQAPLPPEPPGVVAVPARAFDTPKQPEIAPQAPPSAAATLEPVSAPIAEAAPAAKELDHAPERPQPAPTPMHAPAVMPATRSAPEVEVAPESAPEPAPPQPGVTTAAVEPTSEGDDFTRLYGLSSVAIAAIQAAGIRTYRQLAGASVANLKAILTGAGEPNTDPSMWPQQGRFAAGGKWKQLDARFKSQPG